MKYIGGMLIAVCQLFAQPAPLISVNVRQVLVPVIVADRKGHSVTGLIATDFQVTEDGVPQDIVAFTKETAAALSSAGVPPTPMRPASGGNTTGAPSPSRAAAGPPRHITVICFDALHTSFASFVRARTTVSQLFERGDETGDLFVLVTLGHQLRIIQPATGNRSVLHAKLDTPEVANMFAGSETPQMVNALNDVKRRMDVYCAKCACGRNAGNQKDTCDVERQQIRQELEARSEQFAMFDNAFFAGLKSVVEELAKLEGHRTLVLVSDGFSLMPGRELYATVSAYLPDSPYFRFDPGRSMQPVLDESLKVAAAQNIVVSTIDTRGLYSASFRPGGLSDASNAAPGATGRQDVLAGHRATDALRGGTVLADMDSKWSSVERENGSVLEQLAETTGGLYFHDSNDLLKGFRQVLEDKSQSYVLAYVPTNSAADGKFRHITVTVNAAGVKPGNLIVRSKSGYWAELH